MCLIYNCQYLNPYRLSLSPCVYLYDQTIVILLKTDDPGVYTRITKNLDMNSVDLVLHVVLFI